jgi:hypothetical protein
MKTLHRTVVGGICCIMFGILDIVIVVADFQYRNYVFFHVGGVCKSGSGCPVPAMHDELVWLGVAAIIAGFFLLSYKKIVKKDKE